MNVNIMRGDHLRMLAALSPAPFPSTSDGAAEKQPGAPKLPPLGEVIGVSAVDIGFGEEDAPH